MQRSDTTGLTAVLVSLSLGLAWVVWWYWPTASQIVDIWWRSDTFAHGMLVLPIFAWLVWDKRAAIGALTPAPVTWMALPVAAMGFGWLLGQMVSVDGLSHFSLVAMLVLAMVGGLGFRLARVIAFPLLFLFFAVPFGEFIQPTLMHYTAEFTVAALRLSGIPVYQEGLYFVVPNGRWSVVEACSGLRYLIASLFVGTLYAYLNYVSVRRRLLFMLVALVVPIVANWIRAYLTVMIGYLFGHEFVQGFIHIVYGWVFFGVVVLLMFGIGSIWRENAPAAKPAHRAATSDAVGGAGHRALAVLPLALVTAAFPLALRYVESPVQPFTIELQAPAAATGWAMVDEADFEYLPNYSGHRGELLQHYRRDDGAVVGLYVAYYAKQRDGKELVMWGNRLTGRGDQGWRQVNTGRDRMPVGPTVNTLLLGRDASRLVVWHWYWTNRRVLTSDVMAKAILALDQLTGQPDAAAFIAVYTREHDWLDDPAGTVEDFLAGHAFGIDRMLVQAEFGP